MTWAVGNYNDGGARDVALDAIRSATSVAAEHLGLDSDIGVISAGKVADLVAVRGNPLENTNTLRTVEVVVKNGFLIKTSNALPQ